MNQVNGWMDDAYPNSNFAAKMELIVLFNWFSLKHETRSLNELFHDLTKITGKPHAKFGAVLNETVAGYWEQINTRTLSYYI